MFYKKSLLPLLLSLTITMGWSQISDVVDRCGTTEMVKENLIRNPELMKSRSAAFNSIKSWIETNRGDLNRREVVTIPVVVHIVWNMPSENIPTIQVQSQIDALNADFRKLNSNRDNIPDEFKSLSADIEIEFCLASITPEGQETDGVTRTKTDYESVGSSSQYGTPRIYYSNLGGKDGWDPNLYINIWVATVSGALGKACRPGECLSTEDGLLIDPVVFGTTCNVIKPYHLGRTTTHEMGHFFDLQHMWGTTRNDCYDGDEDFSPDFIDDTPNQDNPHQGCPTHPVISCGSNDMFMNYMDYVYDDCMSMFTVGQKERMLAALMTSRSGLLTSNGCGLIRDSKNIILIFPNPADDCLHVNIDLEDTEVINVSLFNSQGILVQTKLLNPDDVRSIDTSRLSNGIYFINFFIGTKRIIKKFIIHHK